MMHQRASTFFQVAILVQFMIENTHQIFGCGLSSLFGGSQDVQHSNSEDSLGLWCFVHYYFMDVARLVLKIKTMYIR